MRNLLLFSLVMLLANVSIADEDLAKKHNCMTCHQIDRKLVGPAYREVAEKYSGQGDMVETLVKKVRAGGSGVWGPIPMPPNPAVSEEDIRKLVQWVLSMSEPE